MDEQKKLLAEIKKIREELSGFHEGAAGAANNTRRSLQEIEKRLAGIEKNSDQMVRLLRGIDNTLAHGTINTNSS